MKISATTARQATYNLANRFLQIRIVGHNLADSLNYCAGILQHKSRYVCSKNVVVTHNIPSTNVCHHSLHVCSPICTSVYFLSIQMLESAALNNFETHNAPHDLRAHRSWKIFVETAMIFLHHVAPLLSLFLKCVNRNVFTSIVHSRHKLQ